MAIGGISWNRRGSLIPNLTAEQIWDRLSPHVHPKDNVLIHAVGRDHQGWLPQDAWNWINSHQHAVL
jgi:hypothetical protein